MGEIKVNIDPEAFNQAIIDTIATSTVGEELKKAIEVVLNKNDAYTRTSVMQTIVKEQIRIIVQQMFMGPDNPYRTELEQQVQQALREKLTEEVISQMVEGMIKHFTSKY